MANRYLLKMYQPTFCIRNPNRINPFFPNGSFFNKLITVPYPATVVGLTPVLVDVYFSTSSSTVIFPPFVVICSKWSAWIFFSISRSDKVRRFPFGVASLWSKRQLYTQRSFPISSTYLNRYLPSDNCISPLCNIRPL